MWRGVVCGVGRWVWLVVRLLRLVGGVFAVSLHQELAHRANLAVSVALTALAAAGTLGALAAVYSHVQRLAGWRFGEAVVLLGVYLIVTGLLETFVWPNLTWFGGQVKNGQLDDLLLTPAPSLFTASFGASRPLALNGALLGVAFVVGGLRALGPWFRRGAGPVPHRPGQRVRGRHLIAARLRR